MNSRVLATSSQGRVIVNYVWKGLSPDGVAFETETLADYQVEDGRLRRAQMFYYDLPGLIEFLKRCGSLTGRFDPCRYNQSIRAVQLEQRGPSGDTPRLHEMSGPSSVDARCRSSSTGGRLQGSWLFSSAAIFNGGICLSLFFAPHAIARWLSLDPVTGSNLMISEPYGRLCRALCDCLCAGRRGSRGVSRLHTVFDRRKAHGCGDNCRGLARGIDKLACPGFGERRCPVRNCLLAFSPALAWRSAIAEDAALKRISDSGTQLARRLTSSCLLKGAHP